MRFVDVNDFGLKYDYLRRVYDGQYLHNLFIYGSDKNRSLHFVLEFIKSIYCVNGGYLPCNNCSRCSSIDDFNNVNVKFIIPLVNENSDLNRDVNNLFCGYVKENTILNESSWGEKLKCSSRLIINKSSILKLQDFMLLQPLTNKPKICIIWLPELLNNSSANSILKILEEPTDNTFFIFISNNDKIVKDTIKSRTIKIFFEDRCISDANDEENRNRYMNMFIDFLRLCYVNNYEKSIDYINDISNGNIKSDFSGVIYNGLLILRSIIYEDYAVKNDIISNTDVLDTAHKVKNILDFQRIKLLIKELEKSLILIQNNVNTKIAIFILIDTVNKIIKKK